MSLMLEGEYGPDTYDGPNSESLAALLRRRYYCFRYS